MYTAPHLAVKYARYYLTAANGRGHGIHSPFVYEFVREVLMDRKHYPAYTSAEDYRVMVKKDRSVLNVNDMGAGSVSGKTNSRRVCDIARTSVKPSRYSRLLYRIATHYGYQRIIELGTSLGVTSSYLAAVPGIEKFITIEGSPEIAEYAEAHFTREGLMNTVLMRGNFDDRLHEALELAGTPDLVFVDGNHRKEPTMRYFRQIIEKIDQYSCIVFDDIHWSKDMEDAWEEIRKDPRVKLSIDLFFVGLVFFRESFLEKQAFTIRF